MRLLISCLTTLAIALFHPQAAFANTPTAAKAISCPEPQYPKGPEQLGQEGAVVLIFSLFADGSPREISIASTSGVTELDAAGIAALQKCKFDTTGVSEPDLLNKKRIRFAFILRNKITCPPLTYPKDSLAANHQGTVKLNVRIEPDGRPVGFEILSSSGHKELDDTAIANALGCTFPKSDGKDRRWIERHYPFKIATPAKIVGECKPPEYPARSLRENEEGRGILRLLISETGQVLESQIQESTGHRRLDRAAEAAFSICKFSPEMVDGIPRRSWFSVGFNFSVGEGTVDLWDVLKEAFKSRAK